MNVLHIDEQRGWRGGEQQVSYLIRGLARRGHVVVIAGRPDSEFLRGDHGTRDLERVGAPFATEFDPWTAWTLARTVNRCKIDILHAHTSHAHTAACLARVLAGRGKVVVSRRVDFPPRNGPLNRWKYRLPDHFIAVSGFIAQVMRDYGIEESRLTVVHSATDPARFDVAPLPRSALGVPEGVPLLGNVAALVGHKDHATLLSAMPFVLRELPALHLVIVGDGELRPRIEAEIARLGLGRSVHLLGYRKDVPRILRALDAFVLSSKEEGFGGAALEAMACGLPVVSTAAGGMPETVIHEKTGLLTPVRDPQALAAAVTRVFRDPGLAAALAQGARSFVHDGFTVDTMVEGNLRIYERLIKERK
jgi:glycosyltransferase involved in cell wall biosynthesis